MMNKEKPVLFKQFLIDAIVNGNRFDLNDGNGERLFFKTQTRRNHRLGDVGDRLWVKEQTITTSSGQVFYRRDKNYSCADLRSWGNPLFMLKKHARIWLEIIGVRQERLADISQEDCFKEGIIQINKLYCFPEYGWESCKNWSGFSKCSNPQDAFFDLIRFIAGNKKFDSEDWRKKIVWVHDFKLTCSNDLGTRLKK